MADNPSFTPAGATQFQFKRYFDTNTATGAVVEIQQKTNLATGAVSYVDTAGVAYVPVGTTAEAPIKVLLGSETVLTDDFAGTASALTVPANAANAVVHVYDGDGISYTLDGVAPTATTGIRVNAGGTFELESADELADFLCFSLGTGVAAGLYVEYANVSDDQIQSRA